MSKIVKSAILSVKGALACLSGSVEQARLEHVPAPDHVLENEVFQSVQQGLLEIFGKKNAKKVYLVGGFTRDLLLGRKSNDIDVMVLLSGRTLIKLGFRKVDAKTSAPVYFMIHPVLGKIEAALPRIDVKVAPGYNGFEFFYSRFLGVAADLLRRDFTVNAIALRLDGMIADPLGGIHDLSSLNLVPCRAHSFIEDPLRIYRAIRFGADGWALSSRLAALIGSRDWKREMAALPVERKTGELMKAMSKAEPWRFFDLYRELAFDGEFLPEVLLMPQVPAGPAVYRPDLYTHSCEALKSVAARTKDPIARLSAFLHDIGKLVTVHDTESGERHHNHDQAGHDLVGVICQRLRLSNAEQKQIASVCLLHTQAQRWSELRDSTRIRLADKAQKSCVHTFLPLIAEANGAAPLENWEDAIEASAATIAKLGIDARLMKGCRKCIPKGDVCEQPGCPLPRRNRLPLGIENRPSVLLGAKTRWFRKRKGE